MPLYDYCCEKCGTEFEVERPLGATGSVKCPNCGSAKTAKVFSAAGIVFKGSGFYVTDSKSGSGDKKSEKSGKPIEKKSEKSEASPTTIEKPKPGANKDKDS